MSDMFFSALGKLFTLRPLKEALLNFKIQVCLWNSKKMYMSVMTYVLD
jgi:hypothetical protein